MNHIKPEHSLEVDRLIAGLWDGEIGEVEFFERALETGMSINQIGAILDEVREEDGT
jgi:hypothetical protein